MDENENLDEELDNVVVLNDEEYVILLPMTEDNEEEEGEVVILKVEDSDDEEEESYVSVDDEAILNQVFDIFKERFKDDFDFVD